MTQTTEYRSCKEVGHEIDCSFADIWQETRHGISNYALIDNHPNLTCWMTQ